MEMTPQQAAKILRKIADAVEAGNSFQGRLEYEVIDSETIEFAASYRTGNSEGQGCINLVRKTETVDVEE